MPRGAGQGREPGLAGRRLSPAVLREEIDRISNRVPVGQQLLRDGAGQLAVDVGGGDVDEVDLLVAAAGQFQQRQRSVRIHLQGHVQRLVEDDRRSAVENRVHFALERVPLLVRDPQTGQGQVAADGDNLLANTGKTLRAAVGSQSIEDAFFEELLQALLSGNDHTVDAFSRTYQDIDPAHARQIGQRLGDQGLPDETGGTGDEERSVPVIFTQHVEVIGPFERRDRTRPAAPIPQHRRAPSPAAAPRACVRA